MNDSPGPGVRSQAGMEGCHGRIQSEEDGFVKELFGDPPDVWGVTSELHFKHPDLFLADTIRNGPPVSVEPDYFATGTAATDYLFFEAVGDDFDRFHTSLQNDHTVTNPQLVSVRSGRRTFRVEIPASFTLSPLFADLGARIIDVVNESGGWTFVVQLPSRDVLGEIRTFCDDAGITFHLKKLRKPGAGDSGNTAGLSPSQYRTLRVAIETGYFDVPRGITQSELADRVGVSPSAVSQRLRRATRTLIEQSLDGSL